MGDLLKGRTCVVAGANGLIGSATANMLAESGARVFSLDREFSRNPKGEKIEIDLGDEKAVADFTKKHLTGESSEWVFIHCAYPRTEDWGSLGFENVTLEKFNENVKLQLGGTFLWNRNAVQFLKSKKARGSLINFSSIYGVVGPDYSIYEGTPKENPVPYSAIKAGVIGLTRYIATVYGGIGIRANVIVAGGVRYNLTDKFIKAYSARTPLGRMAEPADIAGAVEFLASPRADYMTGAVLPVDGGWTAW